MRGNVSACRLRLAKGSALDTPPCTGESHNENKILVTRSITGYAIRASPIADTPIRFCQRRYVSAYSGGGGFIRARMWRFLAS